MDTWNAKLARLLQHCPACGAARTRYYWWQAAGYRTADYECGARYVVKNDRLIEAATMCERGIETVIRLTREEAAGE